MEYLTTCGDCPNTRTKDDLCLANDNVIDARYCAEHKLEGSGRKKNKVSL